MITPVADAPPVRRRAIAAFVDLIAILCLTAALSWVGVGRLDWPSGPYDWLDELGTVFGEHADRLVAPGLVLLAVAALWQLIGRLVHHGSTIGERAVGLVGLDTHGQPPHPLRVVLRCVLGVVTAWPIGWWLCLIDPAGQTLADRLSGFRLVHARAA